MEEIFQNITGNTNNFVMFLIFFVTGGVGGLIAISAIVFNTRKEVRINKEREMSRREIAAYIAEGSMSAEDGERLLNAGPQAATDAKSKPIARSAAQPSVA